jgi:hypothetical protein
VFVLCGRVSVRSRRKKKVTMMASQIVKVKRDKLAACMACPLCNKLFRDATTISECLHTCQCFSLCSSNF